MSEKNAFDPELIKRYDKSGPRYTSYPTAVAFTDAFSARDYVRHAKMSNDTSKPAPLSLYFHIPFCDTVCFYCACNKIATKDYSKAGVYLDYLYREIEMQAELFDSTRKVEQLHFGGGTPTFLSIEQMKALMGKIRQHFDLFDNDEGEYSIEIDPRSVTRETIKALRDIGFTRFSLGVQDVDEKVQKAVNRIQPLEMSANIIKACRDFGATSISVDLIYGLPLQTLESFSETIDKIIELSTDRISVFNYAHLPTLFKPQRRINDDELPDAETKLAILEMSIDKLTQAGYVNIGMDHFAKPSDELALAQSNGTLHRNFQGYTTHSECDLIGFGVSSIGSIAGCYSQNEKDLQGYYKAIDERRFAVIKGLSLNDDDKLRRVVIQELACHFKLDFNKIANDFDIDFDRYFAQELVALQLMQSDQLLSVSDNVLSVSPYGRFLIRNICMVFDKRLREQKHLQRFSKVI